MSPADPTQSEALRPDAPDDVAERTERRPHPAADELAAVLNTLERVAPTGDIRDALIMRALDLAAGSGIPVGVRADGVGVRAVIHLPAGPVSYPLPHDPAGGHQERPDERRVRVDHFVSQVRGVEPSRSLYHLTRAAGRWLSALSLDDRAEISGISVTFNPDGTGLTISVLRRGESVVVDTRDPRTAMVQLARHLIDDSPLNHEPADTELTEHAPA